MDENRIKYLEGANYPMKKTDLINIAKKNNAPKEIIVGLTNLPIREYETPKEVFIEFDKINGGKNNGRI